jgi:MFS family permease
MALRFIVLIGILSYFADFTYEGSRSIIGPYLATLHATGTIVGIVTGFGELLGYGLRLFSGRWADATGRYWPITIFGYVVQMASVPALALTGSWPAAAALIILERVGKAIRNPPRDVMLSHAGKQAGGYGWAFGLHEALDQFGAMFGPLAVAAILAHGGSYREAFAVLLAPALESRPSRSLVISKAAGYGGRSASRWRRAADSHVLGLSAWCHARCSGIC